MSEQTIIKDFGYIPSGFSEGDLRFDPPRVRLPRSYDMAITLPSVRNQGATPKCVSVAVTDMLVWYGMSRCKKLVDINDSEIWKARKNQHIAGMTPREALSLIKTDLLPLRIQAYAKVDVEPEVIKKALVANGALLVGLPVRSQTTQFWMGNGDYGGHACLIVGYNEVGAWIRNSWGQEWGLAGYAHMVWDELDNVLELWTIVK